MEFLLDLLVLPEGPRLRDKVSHGEVNLDEDMSNSVFRMCIYIIIASYNDLSRYLSPSSEEDTRASSSLSDYRALFHPKRYVLLIPYSEVPNKQVYSFIPNERVGLLF